MGRTQFLTVEGLSPSTAKSHPCPQTIQSDNFSPSKPVEEHVCTLESLLKGLTDYVRPTEDNLSFDFSKSQLITDLN